MSRLFVACVVLLGCASQKANAPRPEEEQEEGGAPVPEQQAQAQQDDLATAFEREEAAKPVKPVLAPSQPAAVDRRGPYRQAMELARASLYGKSLDAADSTAAEATRLAEELSSEERLKAWQLAFQVKAARGEPGPAQETALAWLRACGPEHAEGCRGAALAALTLVHRFKGANATAVTALVTELQKAESCVVKAEQGTRGDPCLGAAERLAASKKDGLQLARIALVHALAEKSEAKRVALLERAEARCQLPQCAGVRRRALKALGAAALAANDMDAAVKHAVREGQVYASTLEPEQRLYARTEELEKLCAQYDAKAGPGACRKLEKQLTGGWTFRDFSLQKAGEGLQRERVAEVNEHFAPLLQECLEAQARRLVPPDAVRYEVKWLVTNDGRVGEAHLRRDLDDTELAKCLRAQFVAWRYPRYEGEFQHVEQSFTVTATQRRTMR